jgi:FTR1 family protein
MFSALIIALREGVEAALVVGIVLVYLDRTGRRSMSRYAWSGMTAAILASFAGAYALQTLGWNQEGFEGVLMLVAAFFVVTMIVWMRRVARTLRRNIEARVETLARRNTLAAAVGLAAFVFFMVLREGVELVLILRAVEVSSEGVGVWAGTVLGLGAAVAVGLFFFKGTLKVPLHRFFAATSAILMVVAAQLTITGVHELSEAQWIPSSQREMALVGPIVRNDIFFFVIVLGVATAVVLREWLHIRRAAGPGAAPHAADRRRLEWELRRQRRWTFAGAAAFVLVVGILTGDYLLARAAAAPPQAQEVLLQAGQVRIPMAAVSDAHLHFYSVTVEGSSYRFLVIRKPGGEYGVALDACLICGPKGYRQDGLNVICRNCDAAIYIPSIGDAGGCNPIGLPWHTEGGDIVIAAQAFTEAATLIKK